VAAVAAVLSLCFITGGRISMPTRITLKLSLLAAALFLGVTSSHARAEDAAGKGSVAGKILYPDGTPGVGVTVQLVPRVRARAADESAPAEPGEKRKGRGAGNKVAAVAESTADQSGAFAIADVPAGRYAVVCRLKGVGNARQPVNVTAGGTAEVTLKLVKAEAKKPGKAKKPGAGRKRIKAGNQ
jgi:hypothetical protein